MKRRPPVTDAQRWFFSGVGLIGILLVAELIGRIVNQPAKPEPCSGVPYTVEQRGGGCYEVRAE